LLAWLCLAILLALWVLILGIGALLWELLRGCLAGILALWRVLRLLAVSKDLLERCSIAICEVHRTYPCCP
jgi:hypothetical protein